MSREYVYQQKDSVKGFVESSDGRAEEPVAVMDTPTVEKLVLCMALHGSSPYEGIRQTFIQALNYEISIGRISSIIKRAAEKARIFDDQVDLSLITQGANDEIFQAQTPILTGADPESTYIYLLEEAKDRKAETWETYMSDAKDKGLSLEVNISDQAKGLTAGVAAAFPDSEYQPDVFHVISDIRKAITGIERKAYAAIKREYELKRYIDGKTARQKHKDEYEEQRPKTLDLIRLYDVLFILFGWFRELLGFSGYNAADTKELMEYVLEEFKNHAKDYPKLLKELDNVIRILPSLLSFITRLEKTLEKESKQTGIPLEAFQLMYREKSYEPYSGQSSNALYQIVLMLMGKYDYARERFENVLDSTKKASSIVENVNGRIRVYTDAKRNLKGGFFVLMKVFFNTEPYTRSRVKERKGKSPLELLTGKPQPRFLEALGY